MASLREHERLCELRYESVERRLASVETKIDELTHLVNRVRDSIIATAVRAAAAIFVAVAIAAGVIKLV